MFHLKCSPVAVHLNAVLLAVAVALCTVSAPGRTFAQAPSVPNADRLTPSELEEILGPIALYPDPLLANVLAASVYPEDVAVAAKFVAAAGKPTTEQIEAQSWEDPVKAVAEFPDVIKMMGDFPDWTIALGQAYLTQAKDVMDTVQSLRTKAWDNGSLRTSPEMTVVQEQKVIYIQPADPQIIYVPTYNPVVVYAPPRNDAVVAGVIGFGLGITAGLIIANNMDCHWHGGCVGWGWGYRGPYWGHSHYNKTSVKVTNNINVGDVNIGNRGDVNIKGGDTKIKGGDRTNINLGDRNASNNRVGNEGNAWAPDRSKKLATSLPSESGKLKGTGSNRMPMPDSGSRNPGSGGGLGSGANRPNTGSGASTVNRPNVGGASGGTGAGNPNRPNAGGTAPGGASGANRPNAGGAGSAGSAKPAVPPSQRPATGAGAGAGNRGNATPGSAARPSSQGNRQPATQRPLSPEPRPSAFDNASNNRADSSRGNASRKGASGGGASRSGAGVGARSGGGARGGGSKNK